MSSVVDDLLAQARRAVGSERGSRRGAGVADGEADAEARQGEGEDESEGGERGGRGGVPGTGAAASSRRAGTWCGSYAGSTSESAANPGAGFVTPTILAPETPRSSLGSSSSLPGTSETPERRWGSTRGRRGRRARVDRREGGALVLGAETTDAVGPATDPAEAPRAFGRRRHRPRKVSASAPSRAAPRGRPRDQLCSGVLRG